MIKKIFFLSMAFLCLVANAQNALKGTVTDTDGTPLIGANIYLPNLNKGAISNTQGEYKIEELPKGKIKVLYSYIGYASQLKTLILEKKITQLNVTLATSSIQSQEVVVTGASTTSQHNSSEKIDVLSLSNKTAAPTTSFVATLTKIPGIDLISKGEGVGKPVIRGLSRNDIVLLNDGVRIENYQFGDEHPLGIDGTNVSRVEVIKGAASLLYGSDAIGGVMNFIREYPAPMQQFTGTYGLQLYSNTTGIHQYVSAKKSGKKWFGGIYASQKSHADYRQAGGDYVPNTRFREWYTNASIGHHSQIWDTKLNFDYFAQKLGMSNEASIPLISSRGRVNNQWYQDLNYKVLDWKNTLRLGTFKWKIDMAYQQANRALRTTETTPFIEMRLNTFTYDSKLFFPADLNSEYILGVQGMIQKNTNLNNRPSILLPDAKKNNIGVIAIAKHTFLDKFTMQAGIRYDNNQLETEALHAKTDPNYVAALSPNYNSVNGSVGAVFHPNKQWVIRANIAKSYRTPNISELASNGVHDNRYVRGNVELNPENAYECDVNIHYHTSFLSVDLSGFYNHIKEHIYLSPTNKTSADGFSIYQYEQNDANLYGGEFAIHLHPTALPFLHIKCYDSFVIGKQTEGDYLPFIPAQKIHYEVGVHLKKKGCFEQMQATLSGVTALRQDKPSPFETATPGYTVFNCNLSSQIRISSHLYKMGLTMSNLFNRKYIDHLSTLKEMNLLNQGRNIILSFEIPFG